MKYKVITCICILSICICMTANVKARAITAGDILEMVNDIPGISSITSAYNSLTDEQQKIVMYLIGHSDYIYLTARGFTFDQDPWETTGAWKAKLVAIGYEVLQYLFQVNGWGSRADETFRQYLSSCIVYAQGITLSFDAWYDYVTADNNHKLFVPYSAEAFSAWTNFYNDPTGDGISTFGDRTLAWGSGIYYDFAFDQYTWNSASAEATYNDYIINNSPVLYTPVWQDGGNHDAQEVIGFNSVDILDALYIQRGDYQFVRFGYSDQTFPTAALVNAINLYINNNRIISGRLQISYRSYNQLRGAINLGSANTLQDCIYKAFKYTPFAWGHNGTDVLSYEYGWYPFIEHVYLVDSLSTLANLQEIFNDHDLGINSPDNDNFIQSPTGTLITPITPFPDLPDLIDNSTTINGDPVTINDFSTNIVDNSVTNNYYVSDETKINVPVTWFDNEYTDQLNEDSQSFIHFVKDCVESLGELQVYMYGAIVIGLAGGIVKKLLL